MPNRTAETVFTETMKKNKAWEYQRAKEGSSDEWLTPPEIIKALGVFDLDPCAPEVRPWDTAKDHITIHGDGLNKTWKGRVWCNPPYKTAPEWLNRCKKHRNAIALVFARTETRMFFDYVWNGADAVFFFKGRITFLNPDGSKPKYTGGAPSCLVAYGQRNVNALKRCRLAGAFVELNKPIGEKHETKK